MERRKDEGVGGGALQFSRVLIIRRPTRSSQSGESRAGQAAKKSRANDGQAAAARPKGSEISNHPKGETRGAKHF